MKKQNSQQVVNIVRKGSTSGGKVIKMGTGRAATDIGQEAVSGGPEADGAVAMVAQVGGPEADGGADGGSDHSAQVPSMDEELFAYIGPDQRRKEFRLRQVGHNKLYKIRTQLRSGKTVSGRALQQQELTSLQAQEVELVKKRQLAKPPRALQGRGQGSWHRARRGHVSG